MITFIGIPNPFRALKLLNTIRRFFACFRFADSPTKRFHNKMLPTCVGFRCFCIIAFAHILEIMKEPFFCFLILRINDTRVNRMQKKCMLIASHYLMLNDYWHTENFDLIFSIHFSFHFPFFTFTSRMVIVYTMYTVAMIFVSICALWSVRLVYWFT